MSYLQTEDQAEVMDTPVYGIKVPEIKISLQDTTTALFLKTAINSGVLLHAQSRVSNYGAIDSLSIPEKVFFAKEEACH